MFEALIDYFYCSRNNRNGHANEVPFAEINSKSVRLGYIVHPDCCNEDTRNWLTTLTSNYNSCFYKTWNEIVRKDRFDLYVDQIKHYASTYGTAYEGEAYIPNENAKNGENEIFKDLKVIQPIDETDLYFKVFDVLKSGIALKDLTLNALVDYIGWFNKNYTRKEGELDSLIAEVKNRDAISMIAVRLGIYPHEPNSLLRSIVYQMTKIPSIVKGRDLFNALRLPIDLPHLDKLDEQQIMGLATIYNRNKKVFAAIRRVVKADGRKVLNKVSRLAKKHYVPMKVGFWESILTEEKPMDDIEMQLERVNSFKKIRILQTIMNRMANTTNNQVYKVRNGKVYVRMGYTPKISNFYCTKLFHLTYNSLVEHLKKKACKVYIPSYLTLSLPTSEKTFIGNYPIGTSFNMSGKNTIVGIYWKSEWGTEDFDLSYLNDKDQKIGWNGRYMDNRTELLKEQNKESVIFSGDMTSAHPSATEMLYFREGVANGTIKVNQYNGKPHSKFRLFVAQEEVKGIFDENYIVNPNNVKLDVMIEDVSGEQSVGIVNNGVLSLMSLNSGSYAVSRGGELTKAFRDVMAIEMKNYLSFKELLKTAGFTFVNTAEEADIDCSHLEKDSLIKLLAD